MTVAELIEELQKLPPHKEVLLVPAGASGMPGAETELLRVVYRGPDVVLEAR
jgi:hypothetical protein